MKTFRIEIVAETSEDLDEATFELYVRNQMQDGPVPLEICSVDAQEQETEETAENPTSANYTDYAEWVGEVDAVVGEYRGCSVHDLPDTPLAIWFEDGVPSIEAAAWAIEMAG